MQVEHEFTIVADLATEVELPDGSIELKIVKRNARSKATYYLSDIVGVEERHNKAGQVRKTTCLILHRDRGEKIVLGRYSDIRSIVFGKPQLKAIGFRYGR